MSMRGYNSISDYDPLSTYGIQSDIITNLEMINLYTVRFWYIIFIRPLKFQHWYKRVKVLTRLPFLMSQIINI